MHERRTADEVALTAKRATSHRRLPGSPRTVCGEAVAAVLPTGSPLAPAKVCRRCEVLDR